MFERVLNTPLQHLKTETIFQAKRKVTQLNIAMKTSEMKTLVKVLARSKNSKII